MRRVLLTLAIFLSGCYVKHSTVKHVHHHELKSCIRVLCHASWTGLSCTIVPLEADKCLKAVEPKKEPEPEKPDKNDPRNFTKWDASGI